MSGVILAVLVVLGLALLVVSTIARESTEIYLDPDRDGDE